MYTLTHEKEENATVLTALGAKLQEVSDKCTVLENDKATLLEQFEALLARTAGFEEMQQREIMFQNGT